MTCDRIRFEFRVVARIKTYSHEGLRRATCDGTNTGYKDNQQVVSCRISVKSSWTDFDGRYEDLSSQNLCFILWKVAKRILVAVFNLNDLRV